ncbi:MAG TPA: cbb3-type cytochrome c oxidase subunit I [Candidatus Methylomirabilis sp.]|nr:cbb3-type cytochrome c oxidase subunit I [Candidatus Methylomirabilis sp.]
MTAFETETAASDAERRLTGAHLLVAHVALLGGIVTGLLQGLEHGGLGFPAGSYLLQSYYQSVSIHGVLNVLVWTTFFICGFLPFISARAYGMPLASPALGWLTFWVMLAGLVMAAIPLVGNAATVMFTFYAPLKAHWAFYIGLTLVVVGTWLVMLRIGLSHRAWRAQHPGARTPLAAFMSLVTLAMWTLASVGLAAEMLFLLIPWSLGLVTGTDPLLARTLFWFTGHPIVYFWLLPAYISWYTLVPRQAGGRLFSDPMARASFMLFLILSTPLGLHHQVTDPGIHEGWKLVQAFLTFAVFFPSLLTFFNVVASLENAGRARGGTGLVAWFGKLPWGDPSVAAQLLAMLTFCAGGIGGLINASYNMNLVVHNTVYVVGHFHTTVGTAVTLTYMGISYWLVPLIAGRGLWSRRMALAQSWLWFVGMLVFSSTLHQLGLMGMPRRTMVSQAAYFQPEWKTLLPLVGVGGALLFASGVLYLLNLLLTVTVSRRPAPAAPEFAAAISGPEEGPAMLDRLRPWLVVAVVLIAIAYGPTLARLVATPSFNAPGFRVW